MDYYSNSNGGFIAQAKNSQGFTLLELLIVVSILAAISSIGFFTFSGRANEQKIIELAKVEMQEIATAVKKFKQDTGYYPRQGPFALLDRGLGVTNDCANRCPSGACDSRGGVDPDVVRDEKYANVGLLDDRTPDQWHASPVNFMQLIFPPVLCEHHPLKYLDTWDQASGKGWNGPYLPREGYVDTDCTLSADQNDFRGYNGSFGFAGSVEDLSSVNCLYTDNTGAETNVLGNLFNLPAIADPFSSRTDKLTARGGVLYWRNRPLFSSKTDPETEPVTQHERGRIGQPYLLFFRKQFVDNLIDKNPVITPHLIARLVSAGPDGEYGGLRMDFDAAPSITQEDWCSPNIAGNLVDAEDDIVLCF